MNKVTVAAIVVILALFGLLWFDYLGLIQAKERSDAAGMENK